MLCHKVRDSFKATAAAPMPAATSRSPPAAGSSTREARPVDESYDVIVVGGGVSGLTAAYHLQDRKTILLEKEPTLGGTSRREQWKGIWFSTGAAYFTEPPPWLAKFYHEIHLPLEEITSPLVVGAGGTLVRDPFNEGLSSLPFSSSVKKGFKKTFSFLKRLSRDPHAPLTIPVEHNSPQALQYDRISLKRLFQDYPAEVISLLDAYSRSFWGVPSSQVSAYAGINFLASELGRSYTFQGGNGFITEVLNKKTEVKKLTNAFVDRVRQDEKSQGKVTVSFLHDNTRYTIEGKACVLALPKYLLPRIVEDLPRGYSTLFSTLRYGAYMVGELLSHEVIYGKEYGILFMDTWMSDLAVADWMPAQKEKTTAPAVLTFYIPMGEGEGRRSLLGGDKEAFKKKLLGDLERYFPGSLKKTERIFFYRYGHPMPVPFPGLMEKVIPKIQKPWGRIAFAHCDTQGLAAIEAAAWSGMKAARQVLGFTG